MNNNRRVLVIGAGLGGLATALRLAHGGYQVKVMEKGPRAGGRSNVIEEDGFRVDTGPTILVMKDVFEETYRAVDERLEERLEFVQLDPNYRLYFHDGDRLDLSANMASLAAEVEGIEEGGAQQFFQFLGDSARKYEFGMGFVDRNYDSLTDLANPQAGWRMLQTRALQNLYAQVSRYFEDDKLRKAFSFHSMFLGLSPFEAPAMYSLITYADLGRGMWYPRGGVYRLVEDLVEMAEARGVEFHFNESVEEIEVKDGKVSGVRTRKSFHGADLVVSNADLPYTYRHLLSEEFRPSYPDSKLDAFSYACSGYLLYLGVDRIYDHLQHQGLYFSEDYQGTLDAIFHRLELPEEPSFHLNVPTVTDPGLAPPGHSLLYLLAPMPNLKADVDWKVAGRQVREQLISQLENLVDPNIRQHIVWEREFLPTDFETNYNAALGTAFGSLSHDFFQSSYFRPHNKSRDIAGLYFVGQGTYPGIGMPMVMLSAKLVAERINEEW